jgi:hypothetical protein
VPAGWKTIIDSKYGYTFSYPGAWFDISQAAGAVAGTHALASRADLIVPFTLEPNDWWHAVKVSPRRADVGCSEPLNPLEQNPTTLAGQPATLYVRKGSQNDPNVWVLDLISLRSDICYQFQQMTGSAIGESDSKAIISSIQSSFSFGN